MPTPDLRAAKAAQRDGAALRTLIVLVTLAGVAVGVLAVVDLVTPVTSAFHDTSTLPAAMTLPLWLAIGLIYHGRRRHQALDRQARWRVAAFAETISEIPWEITSDGRIAYVGPRVGEILGHDPVTLVGKPLSAVLPSEEAARARDQIARAAAGRQGWVDERYQFMTRGGGLRELLSSAVIHSNSKGQLLGFTGTLRLVDQEADVEAEVGRIHDHIQSVLAAGAVQSVFQPIAGLADGSVIGAEALSRFTADPPMTPDRWFRHASDMGLGAELELLAVEQALSNAQPLPEHLFISVNVSPAT